jgi:hypothetical protein
MRAPRRRRPQPRERGVPPSGTDLTRLSQSVKYIWTAEHKDHLSPAGLPRLRSDATPCPRDLVEAEIVIWLREAIADGDVGGLWEGQPYPQLAWKRIGDVVYEARLSNAEQGWYHGYPLDKTEWPAWLA